MDKKIFITLIGLALLLLSSCNENKDFDYRKACEERDFERAYIIVDNMFSDVAEKKAKYRGTDDWAKVLDAEEKAKEAKRYVILQEALMLMENGDDASLMRIVAIAKEHAADDWLFEELADVAHKIGNEDLACRLEEMNPNITLLKPEVLSVSGSLYGYFEVEDTKIKYTGGTEITIRIKRVKDGMPGQRNKKGVKCINFIADFLGKDGTPLLKRTTCWNTERFFIGSDDYKELLQSNVGDYKTITFTKQVRYIHENEESWKNLRNCQKIKISSLIEYY